MAIVVTKRLRDIADAIKATVDTLKSDQMDLDNAKEAATKAGEAAISTREVIMGKIAELSEAGQWTRGEVDDAAKIAVEGYNNAKTEKAMTTFVGEIKHAAAPLARVHFKALVSIRDTAWDAETLALDGDPAAPKPLRKAWKRKYHALINILAAENKGIHFTTVAEFVAYSVSKDPDHDAGKVLKRLEKIRRDLEAFHVDFPVDDIGFAIEQIKKVDEKILDAARARRLHEIETDSRAIWTPAHIQPPKPAATTVPQPAPDITKVAAAFGAGSNVVKIPATQPAPTPATNAIDDALGDAYDNLTGDNLGLAAAQ